MRRIRASIQTCRQPESKHVYLNAYIYIYVNNVYIIYKLCSSIEYCIWLWHCTTLLAVATVSSVEELWTAYSPLWTSWTCYWPVAASTSPCLEPHMMKQQDQTATRRAHFTVFANPLSKQFENLWPLIFFEIFLFSNWFDCNLEILLCISISFILLSVSLRLPIPCVWLWCQQIQVVQKAVILSPEFNTMGNPFPMGLRPVVPPEPVKEPQDYKAVVMVFLNGGADTFNMLVPLNCPLYDEYHTVRKNVALDPSTLHKINAPTQSCPEFGIHYELDFFKELYDSNELAFAANVGSLVEPLDKASYKSSGERQGHRVLQNLFLWWSIIMFLFFYSYKIRSRRWILQHDAKYIMQKSLEGSRITVQGAWACFRIPTSSEQRKLWPASMPANPTKGQVEDWQMLWQEAGQVPLVPTGSLV